MTAAIIVCEHMAAQWQLRSRCKWLELEVLLEARTRFFCRHDFEELLLASRGAHARYQITVAAQPRLAGLAHDE